MLRSRWGGGVSQSPRLRLDLALGFVGWVAVDHPPGDGRWLEPGAARIALIHVGLGLQQQSIDFFPGVAPTTRWRVEVRAVRSDDGSFDFPGRFVQGPPGDRFLYLNWVNVRPDGSPRLFRRAKLTLTAIDPGLVEQAVHTNGVLVCTVNLTDAKGNPRCVRCRPPDITWRVVGGNESNESTR